MKGLTRMMIIVVLTLLPLAAFAGDLDSPGDPALGSGMPTLEDLYDYLTTGAPWTDPGSFQEPSAAPASTVYTLKEIYKAFKDLIDQCAATPADVKAGVTFFSTESSSWGPQTGTYTGDGNTYEAGVPKTGQTIKYADGDDGDLEKGVAWPSPRFTDNLDGTVTDNLTGLIWLKNANCGGGRNWSNALTFANSLYDGWTGDGSGGDCGLSDNSSAGDWRLPNVKELQSLIDYGRHNPALPAGHPFTGVQSYYYWSSTTGAYAPPSAWYVGLRYGNVNSRDKTYTYYVWPVRGGE